MKKKTSAIKEKIVSQDFFKVIKDFGNYFTADMATKAIAFFSIPVYTTLMKPEDYGVYNAFFSLANLFTVLVSLNIFSSVGRYFYEEKDDFNIFFGTSLILTAIVFFVNGSIIFTFRNQMADYLGLPVNLLIFFIPMSIYQIFQVFFRNVNVALKNSFKVSKVSLFFAIFSFLAAVLFLYILEGEKYKAPIYGYIIFAFLVVIYIIYDLKKYIKFSWPKQEHIKYILSYSVPLIPYFLGDIILAQFDRIMILNINGASDSGLYSLAYNIGAILNAVTAALFSAWLPDYYKHMNNKTYVDRDKDIARIFKIIIFLAIGLTFFSLEIGTIFANERYHEGLSLVPIIVLGYVIFALFQFYGIHTSYKKKTYWYSLMFLLSGVINIVLNKIFIPQYGYVAGAYTTVVSYFILMLLSVIIAKWGLKIPITPIKYIYYPILIYILSLFVYFALNKYLTDFTLFYSLLIKVLIVGVISILVFYNNIKKAILL